MERFTHKSCGLTCVFKRVPWLLCRMYQKGRKQYLLKSQMHTLAKLQNAQGGGGELMWLRHEVVASGWSWKEVGGCEYILKMEIAM